MKHYCKICDMEQEFKKLESGNLLCTKCLSITNVEDKKIEDYLDDGYDRMKDDEVEE